MSEGKCEHIEEFDDGPLCLHKDRKVEECDGDLCPVKDQLVEALKEISSGTLSKENAISKARFTLKAVGEEV